tara:strand:+ start:2953 stop:3723 length:771 start_codon:yes stop_codon:yes gene_type:complete
MANRYVGMKILMLDIETAPTIAGVWSLFKVNVAINQILQSGHTLCFAARWLHEPKNKYIFKSVYHDGEEKMLDTMWDLLDEADVVMHFNGKKFDIPIINREFIKNNYLPPSPYSHIDLLMVVRRQFKFVSNKLDFVCKELGIGSKVQHKGMDLWWGCLENDKSSWATMKRYNIQDIHLLQPLYEKLLPWIPNHPNRALWMEPGSSLICPSCGGTDLRFKGYKVTRVVRYRHYRCNGCGSYPRERQKADAKRLDVAA